MKKAVIAVALSVLVALLSANVNAVAHAQGDLVAPSNVAAQNTGNPGEVRISWDAVPDAAYYRIGWVAYSDVAPIIASGGDWLEHFAFIDIENRGQTEHVIARLTPGVQYAFIMASNDGRYGTPRWPPATGWAFLTLDEAPAAQASLGSTAVNLTWDAVPGATYYRIGWVVYADVAPIIASGGDWLEHFAFIDIANRGQTAHTITRLTPGLLYAFIVAGNDGRYGTPQWPAASGWQFMTPSVVQPTGPDSDRAALVALYDATGGANWTDNTNWRSNSPIGEWYGVTTNDDGRVTELRLHQNNLSGQIPAALGNLSNLEVLLLLDNGLTGPIPPALGSLSNVRIFYLYQNQLMGDMPSSLGNLSNLERFSVRDNLLSGEIPSWLGNLTKLDWLRLDGNDFTGPIPPALGRLSNLTRLILGGNRLTGSVPSWLGGMGSLELLALNDNQLTGEIPAELGNLVNLQRIWLGGNALTGCMPAALQRVADNDFARLSLRFCDDRAALIALYNATGGANWTNRTNWLSNSPISDWHGVTTDDDGRVTELRLQQNNLSGQIPAALGNLSSLEVLLLWDNEITGPVPTWLSGLTSLEVLGLGGNQLMGPIPSELGNLQNLRQMSLRENQLTGLIPSELGDLQNLTYLSLRENQLIGPVASAFRELLNLEYLSLRDNQLSGPIPPELSRLTALTSLDLRGNQLAGPLPSELANLTNLRTLNLRENQLTGTIPISIGALTNLEWLSLQENQFTGEIPAGLGYLNKLTHLNLSQNELTGEVPTSLGDLADLVRLYISNNQL